MSQVSNEQRSLPATLNELARLLEQRDVSDDAILKDIKLLNYCYVIHSSREDESTTLFHDAIEFGQLDTLKRLLKAATLRKKLLQHILATVRQQRGDTLLHHVCRLQPPLSVIHEVYELVGPRCLLIQNAGQQTPVHLALLEAKDSPTLEAFMVILRERTPDAVLLKLLRLYDLSGHTILHLAVLRHHLEFVQFLLKFCRAKNTDAYQIVTLGSGQTLLHLAVSHGFGQMEQLILNDDPKAALLANYAGYDAYGRCMFDESEEEEEPEQE